MQVEWELEGIGCKLSENWKQNLAACVHPGTAVPLARGSFRPLVNASRAGGLHANLQVSPHGSVVRPMMRMRNWPSSWPGHYCERRQQMRPLLHQCPECRLAAQHQKSHSPLACAIQDVRAVLSLVLGKPPSPSQTNTFSETKARG